MSRQMASSQLPSNLADSCVKHFLCLIQHKYQMFPTCHSWALILFADFRGRWQHTAYMKQRDEHLFTTHAAIPKLLPSSISVEGDLHKNSNYTIQARKNACTHIINTTEHTQQHNLHANAPQNTANTFKEQHTEDHRKPVPTLPMSLYSRAQQEERLLGLNT